jgi:hypothetical protein
MGIMVRLPFQYLITTTLIYLSRPDRFGHLELDLEQIEQCIILVRLLMMQTNAVENMALEEEVGFREFCGWIKFGELFNLILL